MGIWKIMKHFAQLESPVFDLRLELNRMLGEGIVDWGRDSQISITTTSDKPNDYHYGNGSLRYDWDKSYFDEQLNRMVVPEREKKGLREWHFDTLCTQFRDTEFEKIYNFIKEKYSVGRVRVMRSEPKTCLSWHVDSTHRIHYPIKTQEGCLMVIGDEVQHMPENTLWYTETTEKHTAFNGSMESRIHLVAAILE
jgi:hypothetical protein